MFSYISKLYFLLFLFSLNYFTHSFAQSPIFKHYSTDEGLPSSEIYHVIQDSKGYIWFATNFGASRFDGYKFQNFDLKDGLLNNTILEIYEDYKGRIWFIPISGELTYFFQNKIHSYPYNDKILETIKTKTAPIKLSFKVETNDNISIGFNGRGYISISSQGIVSHPYNKIDSRYIIDVRENKTIALSNFSKTRNSISILNKNKEFIIKDKLVDKLLSGIAFSTVTPDNTIIYSIGMFLLKIGTNENYEFFKYNDYIIWLSQENKGLWIGSQKNGISFFENYDFKQKPKYSFFKGMSISSMLIDREGSYWFTTLDNGVFFTPSLNFRTFLPDKNGKSNKTHAILVINNDSIWFSNSGNSIYLLHADSLKNFILTTSPQVVISNLLFDSSTKNIWICTNEYLYTIKNNKVFPIKYHYKNSPFKDFDPFFAAKKMIKSRNNCFIIAQTHGISMLRNDSIIYNSNLQNKFYERTSSIAEDTSGTIWLGCLSGLWSFKHNKYVYYGESNKYLKNYITDIQIDNKNRLWLATKGAGVVVYSKDSIINIDQTDGLINNTVTSLFLSQNEIWACTPGGLTKISNIYSQFKIHNYTIFDGLATSEIHNVFVFNNMVYAATNKGLSVFNDSIHQENKTNPLTYITNVKLFDTPINFSDPVILPYDKNFISIEYIGLTYKSAGKTKYKYRLIGIDSTWNYTNNTIIQYPYLPPGNYQFQVYSINNDGYSSLKPASMQFKIKSPFWRTWWFIFIVIIFFIGIVISIYKYRLQEMKIKQNLKDELNKYIQQALTKQMNPHFIYNSLNSIQNFILENDKKQSSKYLSKFANLMRLILENSQNQNIPLRQELSALKLYLELEAMRFKGKFKYIINIENSVNQEIKIPALLIQPFVENAIWHGIMHKQEQYGNLKIDIFTEQNFLLCVITDDGIGREKSFAINAAKRKNYKSYGTEITEKRLHTYNSLYNTNVNIEYIDLYNENNEPAGTTVQIKIHFKNYDLKTENF